MIALPIWSCGDFVCYYSWWGWNYSISPFQGNFRIFLSLLDITCVITAGRWGNLCVWNAGEISSMWLWCVFNMSCSSTRGRCSIRKNKGSHGASVIDLWHIPGTLNSWEGASPLFSCCLVTEPLRRWPERLSWCPGWLPGGRKSGISSIIRVFTVLLPTFSLSTLYDDMVNATGFPAKITQEWFIDWKLEVQ